MIIVTGSVLTTAETFDEVRRLCIGHCERSRLEPGCISHDVHVDCQNPLKLFFFEQWADENALHAHFAVPEVRGFVKDLRAKIVEASGTRIFQAELVER